MSALSEKKILYFVNTDWFFVSHRLALAVAAREKGFEVHFATDFSEHQADIQALGIITHQIKISRKGMNPLAELVTLCQLIRIYLSVRPNLLHLVTPKCVIYGGIVARLMGDIPVIAAISGLGSIFSGDSTRASYLRRLVLSLYKFVLGNHRLVALFQNTDDRRSLRALLPLPEQRSALIRGSGVELDRYQALPEPAGKKVVTFASRLLWEKGVGVFIEAAQIVHERGHDVHWIISGKLDPGNPSAITEAEMKSIDRAGCIDFIGYCKDVPNLFSRSHLVVLPSYYREGIPRVLLEAAACGRAVVTTDNPGCAEAIETDVTGLCVPMRDVMALADAIEHLLTHEDKRRAMGRAGRLLAEREFNISGVVERQLQIYDELIQ